MPSDEPEQPKTPPVEHVPRRPTETDSEAVADERTRLNDEANKDSKNRSHVLKAEQGEYPQGYAINEKAWLKAPPGPPGGPMAVTIIDAQRDPVTFKWQYQLKDSRGEGVRDDSGKVGWFPETKLRRGGGLV